MNAVKNGHLARYSPSIYMKLNYIILVDIRFSHKVSHKNRDTSRYRHSKDNQGRGTRLNFATMLSNYSPSWHISKECICIINWLRWL